MNIMIEKTPEELAMENLEKKWDDFIEIVNRVKENMNVDNK